MYYLERETPVTVFASSGTPEPVETYRWKQVAVSEDLGTLEAFFKAYINPAHKARYKYQIVSNTPGETPIRLSR